MRITVKHINNSIKDGLWVLVDASNAMKAYVKNKYPHNYENEIKRYQTPVKILQDGEKIVIVSITKNPWASVEVYPREALMFLDSKNNVNLVKNTRYRESLLNTIDENREVDDEYFKDMVSTGYVSYEEVFKYLNMKNYKQLQTMKITSYKA